MTAEADVKSAETPEGVAVTKSEKTEQLNKTESLIHELREEAKNYRLKHKATKSEFELYKNEVEEKIKALNAEKETLSTEINKLSSYERKLIESELKTQAVLAGIKDVDLIKLIDISDVKLSEDGVVNSELLTQAVSQLKETKPFLFGDERKASTSTNATFGVKKESPGFSALNLSDEEYNENKRVFLQEIKRAK